MSYERSKQFLTVLIRPVQAASLPERHEGHRPQKPPENAVTKSPSQARSIPANITLKKQPEGRADNEREDKMQCNPGVAGAKMNQSRDQRKMIYLRHPLTKRPSAHDAR